MATSTPIGSAKSVAIETMIAEPMMAFLIPPPVSPNVACTCVNRSTLSAGIERCTTMKITTASTATAPNAASVAVSWAIRFVMTRRRERPRAFSDGMLEASTSMPLDRVPADDDLRREVRDQRHDEQDHAEVEERPDLQVRNGTLVLRGDPARERVARLEQVEVDSVRRDPDHLGDGDRLADGPPAAEEDCGDQPAARVRQQDPFHHLPAGQPEAVGAFLDLGRHLAAK